MLVLQNILGPSTADSMKYITEIILISFSDESQLSGEDADLSNVEALIHSIEGMVFALILMEN